MIFDTHCHLNDEKLCQCVDNIIDNANKVGVTHFAVVGWDKESSLLALHLAHKYPFIYAIIGFHPENVFDIPNEDFVTTLELAKDPKVVAVGEIGLDYHWTKEPDKRELQKQYFIKQIEYANKIKKPISIHNRDAYFDCISILKEHRPLYGGVMHCYCGSVESIKEVIDLGLYISLGGTLTFKNAKVIKDVARFVPLDKLVIETDCPYLAPHPFRGTVNEPKNLTYIIDEIVSLRNIKKEELEEILFKNSCDLFHVKHE